MPFPPLEGYETLAESHGTLYVLPAWKPFLLPDLRDDFARVPPAARFIHRGRTDHFSYLPAGAPGRVIVRRPIRAGIAAVLGDRYLGWGRLRREIEIGTAARRAGILVPEIVAARISPAGPLLFRMLFVIREISEGINLTQYAKEPRGPARARVIRALGSAVRTLHEAGIYHGDLTLNNVLVSEAGSPAPRIHFIDLDRSRTEPCRNPVLDLSNLGRLNRFVEKWLRPLGRINRSDKLRFLSGYGKDRSEVRHLARNCGRGLPFHRFWWSLSARRSS